MGSTLQYDVDLTEDELRLAWLTEDRARRSLMRRAIGPVAVVVGLGAVAGEGGSRLVGLIAVAFGLFLVAQPFLVVAGVLAARRKQGSPRVAVSIGEDGIALTRDGKTAHFAWKDVTAAGQRATYVWYELRGRHRAPIPLRVIGDLDALTSLLRARTRWIG
jgi:hypothetical protein